MQGKHCMQTLIINGSPRKNGDTAVLIRELAGNLEGEVRIVSTYYDKIGPCVDCRYCWEHPRCAIKDDMQEVYRLLNEVDNVILASPIYFSELTGSLLNFASRFQFYYATRCIRKDEKFKMKSKLGGLILTAGGDTKDLSKVLSTAGTLFRIMGVESVGNVFSLQTDTFGDLIGTRAKDDETALESARNLAQLLNEENLKRQGAGQ